MFSKYLHKTLFSIFFLLSLHYRAQNYSVKELDSIADQYRAKGEFQKLVDLSLNLAKQYKKLNNIEAEFNANLIIANELANLDRYKESLIYLDKAEKNVSKIKNLQLKSKLYCGYGRHNFTLGLYERANDYFDKANEYAKQISDKKLRTKRLYVGYIWKLTNFAKMDNMVDSVKSMEKKCMTLDPEPTLYVTIAARFLKTKKDLDSAEYFLNKGISAAGIYPTYERAIILEYFGKLYTEKKEYEKALKYYLEFLSIAEKTKRKIDKREAYKLISETYKALHEENKANEYLIKYSLINDTISNEEKIALKVPLNRIIKEKDDYVNSEKNKLYIIISAILLVSVLLFYFSRKAFLKKQKQKDEVITEKLQETHQLKKQINPSFKEVIRLARNSDQQFLTRFKEVYFDFYETLTSRYPDLTKGDIKLCALLKLNFTNKEITEIEFISIRTVENRIYRIRKKLQLPSDVDIRKWMMDL